MSPIDALPTIEIVATALSDLRDDVMFVGGAITVFLVTDSATLEPRLTDDVDIVVDVAPSYKDEWRLAKRLRELGFAEDSSGGYRCRWKLGPIKIDIMPRTEDRWFPDALAHADRHQINRDLWIRVISVPYFLATKLEAFGDGRRGDRSSSRDIEDIVSVVDGRATIERDVNAAPSSVKDYLRERFRSLLATPDFDEVVAGHLPGDSASQARLPLVLSRMRAIAGAA